MVRSVPAVSEVVALDCGQELCAHVSTGCLQELGLEVGSRRVVFVKDLSVILHQN